jgi:hypothetical protein
MPLRHTLLGRLGAYLSAPATLLVGALAVLSAAQPGAVRTTGTHPVVLSSEQLITRSGSEDVTSFIVGDAFRQFLHDGRTRTVSVFAAQLKEDWVPQIDGVRVVRLSNDEVTAFREQCGALVLIRDFVVKGDVASVWIGRFTRCNGSAIELRYARAAGRWRRVPSTGQGMGEASDPCSCYPVIDAPAGR